MLSRQTILKSIVLFFALIWVADADAAIYKWIDENGKTHFTDDPTRVPEAFRKKPFLKGFSKNKTSESKDKKPAVDEGDIPGKKDDIENEKKADDEKEGLTEAQRSVARAIAAAFEGSIPRYEKYYTTPPSRQKFGVLKAEIASNIPSRKSLLEQVSLHDLPLFQSISEFLKASIAEDEETRKLVRPSKYTVRKRTALILKRLKADAEQKKQFLENIKAVLEKKE